MRRGRGSGQIVRVTLAVAGVLLLLLVLAQVFLPRIAASRIGSRLRKYGSVDGVSVSAWPAVTLLWGDADSVHVKAGRLRISPSQAAKLLWEGRGVDELDLMATRAQVGPLVLSQVSFHKRRAALSAQALASEGDVNAALPSGLSVRLLGSENGQVRVRASGGLFGVGASVEAVAEASEGRLIAHALGLLLENLRLTLFSDAHVYVEGVGASSLEDVEGEHGYRLTMTAKLR